MTILPDSSNPTSGFLDSHDVLRAHDEAVVDLLYIPTEVRDYRWSRFELSRLETLKLQTIARERRAFADTEHRPLLIQSILNTQQVPVVMGTSEIARSRSELVTGKIPVPGADDTEVPGVAHYPVISVLRTGVSSDPTRAAAPLRRNLAWESGGNLAFQAPQPVPIVLSYQIEVLARSLRHINLLDASISRIFGVHLAELSVDLGSPWGQRYASLSLTGPYSDSTSWEGDPAVRLIRHIYSGEMAGWLPQAGQLVRTVRKVRIGFTEPTYSDGVKIEKSMEEVQLRLISPDETQNS